MDSTIFKVAKFELIRQLKKPSFWISILFIPVFMGVIFLISFLANSSAQESLSADYSDSKIAITDAAGVLPDENPFALYDDKDSGIAAIKSGEIDLYYYIPADFAETQTAEFYHISENLGIFDASADVLRGILSQFAISKVSPVDAIILSGSYEISDNRLSASGEDANVLGKAIIPLAILAVFFIFICVFGNRLIMTVVEEKENRISEMILTAVSSKHLIVGKIIALLVLGVIQILTLVVPLAILVFINRDNSLVSMILGMVEISPLAIVTNSILFIFSILLFAGLCTFVGAITPTARDASQFIGPVIIGTVFPLYFIQAFMVAEPNTMVHILTYFPFSAPIAMMLRSAFGTLSTPELLVGLVEITILSAIVVRLTVTAFQKNAINFSMKPLRLHFRAK